MDEAGGDGPVDESAGGGRGDIGEHRDVGDRHRLVVGGAPCARLDHEQGGHLHVAAVGLDDPLPGGAPQSAQPQERIVQLDDPVDSHGYVRSSSPLAPPARQPYGVSKELNKPVGDGGRRHGV